MKEALKGTDAAAIKSASEKLNEVWQAVSTELYKAAAGEGAGGKGAAGARRSRKPAKPKPSEKKDEGVIDAEVVDEKK